MSEFPLRATQNGVEKRYSPERAEDEAVRIYRDAEWKKRNNIPRLPEESLAEYYDRKREANIEKPSAEELNQSEQIEDERKEASRQLDKLLYKTTVSVKELIPNINREGLTLKDGDPQAKYPIENAIDAAKDRTLKHLTSDLKMTYADYIYGVWMVGKEPAEKERIAQIRQEIQEAFEGQIVIDLAAGENVFGYQIADRAGARGYIAIEPAFQFRLLEEITCFLHPELAKKAHEMWREPSQEHTLNKIPVAIVADDMLSFLRRLPSGETHALWCSGVDRFVISDKKYKDEVAQEIMRVLHSEGVYIGQNEMHIALPDSPDIIKKQVGIGGEYIRKEESIVIYRKKESGKEVLKSS